MFLLVIFQRNKITFPNFPNFCNEVPETAGRWRWRTVVYYFGHRWRWRTLNEIKYKDLKEEEYVTAVIEFMQKMRSVFGTTDSVLLHFPAGGLIIIWSRPISFRCFYPSARPPTSVLIDGAPGIDFSFSSWMHNMSKVEMKFGISVTFWRNSS